MPGTIICPFCMKTHGKDVIICPDKKKNIPLPYKKSAENGAAPVFTITIGHRAHGKTCFLSSLFYSMYNLPKRWEGFSFIPLNQETLNTINDNIRILKGGNLPPATPVMFPVPSIILLQNLPFNRNNRNIFTRLFVEHINRENIITFYDVGGETFNDEALVAQNLSILKHVKNLIFLIDLPTLLLDSKKDKVPPEIKMQSLLAVIYNAMNRVKTRKKKGITVCFTKSDLMTDKPEFGPLAEWEIDRFQDEMPYANNLPWYIHEMKQFSFEIEQYIREEYPLFYNALKNNFNPVNFSVFSSLGSNPEGGKVNELSPRRVFDPILWTLLVEGYSFYEHDN